MNDMYMYSTCVCGYNIYVYIYITNVYEILSAILNCGLCLGYW